MTRFGAPSLFATAPGASNASKAPAIQRGSCLVVLTATAAIGPPAPCLALPTNSGKCRRNNDISPRYITGRSRNVTRDALAEEPRFPALQQDLPRTSLVSDDATTALPYASCATEFPALQRATSLVVNDTRRRTTVSGLRCQVRLYWDKRLRHRLTPSPSTPFGTGQPFLAGIARYPPGSWGQASRSSTITSWSPSGQPLLLGSRVRNPGTLGQASL